MSQSGGTLLAQQSGDAVTLLASTTDAVAHTVTQAAGTSIPRPTLGLVLELNVTAAATLVGDTLDVIVQALAPDGVNWLDVCWFTQVLGNGGVKRIVAKIQGDAAQAMYEVATALTAGNVRHLLGDSWRVKYTIVGTGSFTFSVAVRPM